MELLALVARTIRMTGPAVLVSGLTGTVASCEPMMLENDPDAVAALVEGLVPVSRLPGIFRWVSTTNQRSQTYGGTTGLPP